MSAPATIDRAAIAGPGLGRLTRVELRKAVDTRAGFWLLLGVGALSVLVVLLIGLLGHAGDRTLANILEGSVFPAALLLPVVGILLVTSEWTQRTTLVTFTLVPRRGRVIAAKVLAALVLATIAWALCLVASLIGAAASASDAHGAWSLSATLLLQTLLFVLLSMLVGLAFGAAILSSAPAIVLSFVLPVAYSFLTAIHALEGLGHWTDQNDTLGKLDDHLLSGTEWARAGTSLLLWLALPMAIGLWRIARSDAR